MFFNSGTSGVRYSSRWSVVSIVFTETLHQLWSWVLKPIQKYSKHYSRPQIKSDLKLRRKTLNFTQNVIISRFRVDSINFKFNAICIKFDWTDEIQGGPWAEKRRKKEKNWQKAWRSDHKTKKRANLLFLPSGNLQLLNGTSSIIRSTPYFFWTPDIISFFDKLFENTVNAPN